MKVQAFYTTGNRDIVEWIYDKPEPAQGQVEVKTLMTGICSSDAAMYEGKFQLLPKEIQGHEGLGVVTKITRGAKDASGKHIDVGDIVATRGEPAFADFYNAKASDSIIVPDAKPKYLLEPVACAMNIFEKYLIAYGRGDILILGSGWLSMVIVTLLRDMERNEKITVVGHANRDFWPTMNATLVPTADFLQKDYAPWENVIDLSDRPELFRPNTWAENAVVIVGAEKQSPISTNFGDILWKNVEMYFPSPRDENFGKRMEDAKTEVESGLIDVSSMWTHEFRRGRVEDAFNTACSRPEGFKRAYLVW